MNSVGLYELEGQLSLKDFWGESNYPTGYTAMKRIISGVWGKHESAYML